MRGGGLLIPVKPPRCPHTGEFMVKIPCDCAHGKHGHHWIRPSSPKVKQLRRRSRRGRARRS